MRKLLLLLALAAVLFAGCGGGDDDGASDTSAESDGGAETDEASEDPDFSGEDSGDFCALARKYTEEFEDTGEAASAADVEKEYKELAAGIDYLVGEAPGEIKDDAEAVNEAFKELNQLLEKYDYDFAKIPPEEAEAVNVNDPEVEAASNRVESYFEKVCKIDSDEDGDTDGEIDDAGADDTTETTEG